MKRMIALAVVGLLLLVVAPADSWARGRGHGGHGGHGGHAVRGGGGHGHGFHGHGHRFHGHGHRFHGHGFRSSVVIGTGVWLGPYWYPPYYGYPYPYAYERVPVVVEPQTYIQQSPAQGYWYYCEEAKAYYPYVQQCPGGWLTVVPHAAGESPR